MEQGSVDPTTIDQIKIAAASLAGGIVRLIFFPPKAETNTGAFLKSLWLLFGCTTCGFYVAPVLSRWWGISGIDEVSLMGAIAGLIGLSIAGGMLKGLEKLKDCDALEFLFKILMAMRGK